jgi:hypothetical protein
MWWGVCMCACKREKEGRGIHREAVEEGKRERMKDIKQTKETRPCLPFAPEGLIHQTHTCCFAQQKDSHKQQLACSTNNSLHAQQTTHACGRALAEQLPCKALS